MTVFRSGSWWEKPLPTDAPIHPSSATWLTALTALDVSEGNHLNASGQGHISLNVTSGQFDAPIYRVTGTDTSYPVWGLGSGATHVPVRCAPVAQGGTGEGLRIPEHQKVNNWIKPSNNTHGPNSNDSPFQVIDTERGYVVWLSDTYWNLDTLRWECWNGTPAGLSVTFSGGANICYFASYGIDSGNFNEATTSEPSFWPATLTGSGVDPATYQDEPRNQGTGRGNNPYYRSVNYDDFLAYGGLTHVCEVFLTATGDSTGYFPMKGFEVGRGGDILEGTRMRVKATFSDADISAKLTAAGLTGARLAQATLFIKGFRDYGVYVGDNSGSNSRVKLEDKVQESAGGTNPWAVHTQDLQAFGWGDWEIIDANYDPPVAVVLPKVGSTIDVSSVANVVSSSRAWAGSSVFERPKAR